jgi:ribokinase
MTQKTADLPSKTSSICVIGSINMDLVVRTPRFVTAGETLRAYSWAAVAGGKGANQAVAAARLGAKVSMCGCVGKDDFGVQLRTGLAREGIDVADIGIVEEIGTGIALIAVEQKGNNSIYVVGGANHAINPERVLKYEDAVGRAQMVLLQLEIPLEATLTAIELAKRLGVPVLLDPAPAPVLPCADTLLQVDLISPNESEAESLTGIRLSDLFQAKRAAEVLALRGAEQVVIKLGERGAIARDRSGATWHVACAAVEVVDTTAAGDSFSAALAIALAEELNLVEATQFACAAGTAAVRSAGAQPSMPTRSVVAQILREYEFCAKPV